MSSQPKDEVPPLSFKEGVASLGILGLSTLAALGLALALVIQLMGATVAQITPGPGFIAQEGKLDLALIGVGTIFGHPGGTSDPAPPEPLGPFPRGSVWVTGEETVEGLPRGGEGSRLTLVGGRPRWRVPTLHFPEPVELSSISPLSRGIFQKDHLTYPSSFQLRRLDQTLDTSLPNPLWWVDLTLQVYSDISQIPEGTLFILISDLVPDGYQLPAAASPVISSTASAVTGGNSPLAPTILSGALLNASNLEWTIRQVGVQVQDRFTVIGRLIFSVPLERSS